MSAMSGRSVRFPGRALKERHCFRDLGGHIDVAVIFLSHHVHSSPSVFLRFRCWLVLDLRVLDQQGGKGLESIGDTLSRQALPMRGSSLSLSLALVCTPDLPPSSVSVVAILCSSRAL